MIFWKMYSAIYTIVIISGNFLLVERKININLSTNVYESLLTSFSVVPLWLYSYKINYLDKRVWKLYFFVFMFFELVDIPRYFANNNVLTGFIGILISCPCYFTIWSYAFSLDRGKEKEKINSEKLLCLKTFNSRQEAEVLRALLEANGIQSWVRADDCGGMEPRMNLIGDVKLLVRHVQFEKAKEILKK